jgi:hypothetical protein
MLAELHDVGIMFAGEDIAGPAHVGGKLVNLVEMAVIDGADHVLFAQVADHEFICRAGAEFGVLEINPANKEAFGLEPLGQVAANEPAGAKNQGCLHVGGLHPLVSGNHGQEAFANIFNVKGAQGIFAGVFAHPLA